MKKINSEYLYIFALALVAFCYNPLALFFPYGSSLSSHVFYFTLPHLFLASLISLIYISCHIDKVDFKSTLFKVSVGGIAFIALSALIFDSFLFKAIELMAFFTVPLGVSIAQQRNSKVIKITLSAMAAIWAISLFYCVVWPGNLKIGFSGNQNWLAATLFSSFILILPILKNKLSTKAFNFSLLILIPLNTYVLYYTHARVLIPALACCLLFTLYRYCSKKINSIVWLLVLITVTVVSITKKDYIQRTYNADVRGPLYTDAMTMTLKSPFLGHGPGHFQRDFPSFISDELKQRQVYSPVVEHPHNELLHLAATAGLPATFLWLFLLGLSLRKPSNKNIYFYQLVVVSLFVMGMADKPLSVSSSAIIFLIATGLSLKAPLVKEQKTPHFKLGLAVAALLCLYGTFRLYQVIPSQYYFWRGEQLRSYVTKTHKQELLKPLYELYDKSAQCDPYDLSPQYLKASLVAQQSQNLKLIYTELEKTILLAPNYADINYQIAQLYLRQADLLTGEDKQLNVDEAEKYILNNVSLSPWSLKRNRQLIRFYCQTNKLDQALNSIQKLKGISREKLAIRFSYNDRGALGERISSWLPDCRKGLFSSHIFTDSVKANVQSSYLFPKVSAQFPKAQLNQIAFTPSDKLFWQEQTLLAEALNLEKITTVEDLITMAAKDFTYESKQALQRPWKVWGSKQYSQQSMAGLLSGIAQLKGWPSCVIQQAGISSVAFFTHSQVSLINCQNLTLTNLSHFQLLEKLKDKSTQVKVLLQPAHFSLRNQLLSDLLSHSSELPEFCRSATEQVLQLRSYLNNTEISLDTAYFE